MRTIRLLADRVGPREAASPAFNRAARWVAHQFKQQGYGVRRQRVRVPAGNSWGVDVAAGFTTNVIAAPLGFDPSAHHRIVGAHLDTVPQAPGAEDNASGIAVLLEVSRLTAMAQPRLPVVFVAFGGEEPRGEGDDLHHFGSTALVARMPEVQRNALTAMVSLDRVGVGEVVPVCAGGLEAPTVQHALIQAANDIDVPTLACDNQSSDHWSFDKAGLPAARIGGTSYAGYHSAADLPSVIVPSQLVRVGRVVWEWLRY